MPDLFASQTNFYSQMIGVTKHMYALKMQWWQVSIVYTLGDCITCHEKKECL